MYRVLFVDDEPMVLKYFARLLGDTFEVVTALSAAAAMQILEKDAPNIAVVVSDQRMPNWSGIEFLAGVHEKWPSIPRILTTAFADIESLEESINSARVCSYVRKPWDFEELRRVVLVAATAGKGARISSQYLPTLVGSFAHELATPLLSIELGADELDRTLKGSGRAVASETVVAKEAQLEELAQRLRSDAQQARKTLASLAEIASDALDYRSFAPRSAASAVVYALDAYKFTVGERETITLDLKEDFTFTGSLEAVSCVMRNLISNALASCRGKGGAGISILLTATTSGGYIRVADSGEGFAPEVRDVIFQTAVTSKPNGRGLGLLICQLMMDRMGGAIALLEGPEQETVLELSFPPAAILK